MKKSSLPSRRQPLARSKKPIPRVNRKRQAKDFPRKYGSEERVEWVKTQPCAACGVVGYSENAHVAPPSEKGTGYKAGFEWIAPLCGERPASCEFPLDGGGMGFRFIGCHKQFDEYPWAFYESHPDFNPEQVAAQTEKAWQEYSGTSNKDEASND